MPGPTPMETKYLHRALLVGLGFSLLFGLILGRLYYLQCLRSDYYVKRAARQQSLHVTHTPQRGAIRSRNGHPLAVTLMCQTAKLAPEYIRFDKDYPEFRRHLARKLVSSLYGADLDAVALAEKTEAFTLKMSAQNRMALQDESGNPDGDRLRGSLADDRQIYLQGGLMGEEVELNGKVDTKGQIALKGTTTEGKTFSLTGRLNRLRAIQAEGTINGKAFHLKGRLYRKPEFTLRRKLPRAQELKLLKLRETFKLPTNSFHFIEVGKRDYPNGSLAAHVIGLTSSDDQGDNLGIEGIEKTYQKELAGALTRESVEITSYQQHISPLDGDALTSAAGNTVYLTIHKSIQQYAEEALAAQVERLSAKGGVLVALDVPTGEVLAMASYPTFDVNERGRGVSADARRNQCLVSAFAPGSVMKIFTATALLEEGLMDPDEMIDCHNGRFRFPVSRTKTRLIKDTHHSGIVPVHQAFAESSNVAFVTLGLRMTKDVFYGQLRHFGFGAPTGIDLSGEARGSLKAPAEWDEYTRTSIPWGYELMLTPIQVAAGVAAIANGGRYMRPHVVKEIRSPDDRIVRRVEPEFLRSICSPETSSKVLAMMEEVVTAPYGTASSTVTLPGYRIGGKTGTMMDTSRLGIKGAKTRYVGSFAGVFPIEQPRFVIYALIDEPTHKNYNYTGARSAGPVVRDVAAHALRILGVKPSEPVRLPQTEWAGAPSVAPEESLQLAVAAPRPRAAGELMPDLTGLTMREVVAELNRLDIAAELVKSGVAVEQYPPAGTPLSLYMPRGRVVFASPH